MKRPRRMTLLALSAASIIALGPLLAVGAALPPGIPSSVMVSVGYADTERSVGTFHVDFPSPWCGSPGVQFVGSSTNYDGNSTDPKNCAGGDWDGGAILVTNTGATTITLTNLTVTLPLPPSGGPGSPTCPSYARPMTFDLWFGAQYYYDNSSRPAYDGNPIAIPSGGQAIFAATSGNGTTCETGNYPSGPIGGTFDFDTSEGNFLSGCTPTNDTTSAPRITFSADGYSPTTYVDVGHTLDTGGIDTGTCSATAANPEWPNESLGWRAVNSTCGESCVANQLAYTATPTATVSVSAIGSQPATVSSTFTYGVVGAIAIVLLVAGYFLYARRRR
jgi:hypothetical protein